MAESNPAPRQGGRLTRTDLDQLARDLVRADYALRSERPGGDAALSRGELLRKAVRNAWRRLMRWGRSTPSAGGGGNWEDVRPGLGVQDSGVVRSWEPRQGRRTGRQRLPDSGKSPFDKVISLNEQITKLPKAELEEFEDAVLHLLRSNAGFRRAYDRSPESMPHVTRYAGNAHERELLREKAPEPDSAKTEPAKPAVDRSVASVDPATGTTPVSPLSSPAMSPVAPVSPMSPELPGFRNSLVGPEGIAAAYTVSVSRPSTPGSGAPRSEPDSPKLLPNQSATRARVR